MSTVRGVRNRKDADYVGPLMAAYEAVGSGNPGPLVALMHPQIEWSPSEHNTVWPGGPFTGPEAVLGNVFGRIPVVFGPTFNLAVDRFIGCGDTVVMQGHYQGVVQTTGKSINARCVHVWDLEDGKAVRMKQFVDTYALATAMRETPVS
jgi:ketosteroid isomerase-like protein